MYILTLGGRDPGNGAELSRGVWRILLLVNVMIYRSFGFSRLRDVRTQRGEVSISACSHRLLVASLQLCLHCRALVSDKIKEGSEKEGTREESFKA